jgi:hypothetical protein
MIAVTEALTGDLTVEEKIQRLRELFADAPEVGRKALENVLSRLASDREQAGEGVGADDHRALRARESRPPTKIPDFVDIIDSACEGWPGIRSAEAKDYLAKHQLTAEGWYVANDLTVAETAGSGASGKPWRSCWTPSATSAAQVLQCDGACHYRSRGHQPT